MARKGSSKVRTGCLTCKVRKVKCDEGKPRCQRCMSTGRKCDGYVTAASSSALSWHRPRHLFPHIDDVGERRALQFFCEAVGPSLSGPMDPYFWTHLVMQFSTFEPAVRHSVVAISSLYEQIHTGPASVQLLADKRLALCHYNSAIRELKSMDNEPLVLLVCVLFVCIEFLLGDRDAAIQHCKHSVFILENVEASYPWTKEYLSPIIRRLTLFPFFFGVDNTSFPKVLGLDDQIPESFTSFEEVQYYVDGIVTRTISLVRRGDQYRLGDMRLSPVSPELLSEQDRIRGLLNEWHSRFSDFQDMPCAPRKPQLMLCNITLRYEIARIWVETAFEYDETAYDKYLDRFRCMVTRAAELHSSEGSGSSALQNNPKFIFEMGFAPLLYYIVIKCRCLTTRVQALSLMKKLGVNRESLWEASMMHATGRRMVEIEHDVLLDEHGQLTTAPRWPGLPPDEMRIRDSTTAPKPTVQTDDQGHEIRGRMAGFFRRTPEGEIYLQTEFIPGA
ncbi:hypothetical protein F4677DRAFT_430517 [Hypoxylon crocopeplum]|nr:hypothetical protein F4677DRAFT_430517 [Hypoxylon crocopeplum]